MTNLKNRPGRNIQVPGSPRLVWSLLRAGLLDELALMVHPIVLGTGARLFQDLTSPLPLVLERLADARRPGRFADLSSRLGGRRRPR